MNMVLQARSSADGTLRLEVPGYPPGMDYDVSIQARPTPAMTPEEWKAIVLSLAGSVDDPAFERPPQLILEVREPLS